MSGQAAPISLNSFREALKNLSSQSLRMKIDELRNSIAHLKDSNQQLGLFVQGMLPGSGGGNDGDDDQECIDAIQENEVVIARFQDRINLLAAEIKERGLGFQTTTSSSTTTSAIIRSSSKKENHRTLSVLANKDSFDARINGHMEDGNLVIGLPSTVNEKIPLKPNNHAGIDATIFMMKDLSNTGSQLENETSQDTLSGTVNGDEGVYL